MLELEDHRRRIIAETSAFITWGLANPDKVRRIPRKRIGTGEFSRTMQYLFWRGVFGSADVASRDLVRRFLRWARLG
ncbi:MAG TPA: hypothetical protein VM238_13800 [Phycisphaerae bacterium]|nr:hypothetical protein [Phycisphaerae bacterium]